MSETSIERETSTVIESARRLGIGRNVMYAAVGRGAIPAIRLGRRIVIPNRVIERLLNDPTSLAAVFAPNVKQPKPWVAESNRRRASVPTTGPASTAAD